jgi:hypothetical protein
MPPVSDPAGGSRRAKATSTFLASPQARQQTSPPRRDEDRVMTRCLFCQTTDGKRSNEHVFRKAFKERFSLAPGLTFSWHTQTADELEIFQRPVSQFDMTLNAVCRDCNQGWLEDLENEATAVIHELTVGNAKLALSETEVTVLGFWAYIRGLLLTHVYPRRRVPGAFFENAYAARHSRTMPNASYVSLGASTHLVFEAGAVQAATFNPGGHYLGFVGFGLGPLVFLVSFCDASPEVASLARELIEAPRAWFPDSFRRLSPVELPSRRLELLTGEQAQLACQSMKLRVDPGLPHDQLGQPLDPLLVIPKQFHEQLACVSGVGAPGTA